MKIYLIFLCLIINCGLVKATIQNKADPDKPSEVILATANGSTFYCDFDFTKANTSWNWQDGVGGNYSYISALFGPPDPLNGDYEGFYIIWDEDGHGSYQSWEDTYYADGTKTRLPTFSGIDNSPRHPQEIGSLSDQFSTRTSKVVLQLKTGGKSTSNRKNLFEITADATGYKSLEADAEVLTPTPFDSYSIPASSVQIFGRSVGSDGNLYVALPDNANIDVTPIVSVPYYGFNVAAQKYKLYIGANGYPLGADGVRPGAKHVIGEKINLSPLFSPSLSEQPQETALWSLSGTYINAFTVWINSGGVPLLDVNYPDEGDYDSAYGLSDFRIDITRLQWVNTYAWWQTGSPNGYETETINLGLNLTFSNGQQVDLTAKGLLGIHQPTVQWNASKFFPGAVNGEKVTGSGAAGLYKVGLLDGVPPGSGILLTADSQSLVSGRFGITQLITRNSSVPLGSWSDWELDGSMPYDNGDHNANVTYSSGTPYSAEASLDDAPSVDGIGGVWSQDQFRDYFMFRANTPGSIWATLGTVDWNWFGSIVWCTSCPDGWVWDGTPQFFCSQSITPSHQHPEFQKTH